MGWKEDIVNVNGGAIAIGHPIGASGARVLVTLLHEMQKRDAKKGLATLCIGGGMGVALCVEALSRRTGRKAGPPPVERAAGGRASRPAALHGPPGARQPVQFSVLTRHSLFA